MLLFETFNQTDKQLEQAKACHPQFLCWLKTQESEIVQLKLRTPFDPATPMASAKLHATLDGKLETYALIKSFLTPEKD
jgi:hypothetical protein